MGGEGGGPEDGLGGEDGGQEGDGSRVNYQWSSVVISGHQWSSVVINGHQWSSVVISGHQWPSGGEGLMTTDGH